jgi:hypothetical protein
MGGDYSTQDDVKIYKILVRRSKWKRSSIDLGINGRIILKFTLNKYCMRLWITFVL